MPYLIIAWPILVGEEEAVHRVEYLLVVESLAKVSIQRVSRYEDVPFVHSCGELIILGSFLHLLHRPMRALMLGSSPIRVLNAANVMRREVLVIVAICQNTEHVTHQSPILVLMGGFHHCEMLGEAHGQRLHLSVSGAFSVFIYNLVKSHT